MGALAYVGEAWQRRELLRQLAWREAKAGRRQSLLGMAWLFLQPVAYLLVLSLVFGLGMRMRSGGDGVPYPLFLVAGLVPWLFFAGALSAGTTSVVGMADLVRKVSFPRIFCPLAVMAAYLANLIAGLVLLVAMMALYGVAPPVAVLWIIPLLAVTAALAVGSALLLAAANVYTRDAGSAVPLLVQVWFFATPIIYPLEMVRAPLAEHGLLGLYLANPMIGIVGGFRAALFGGAMPWGAVLYSAAVAAALLAVGLVVFARVEKNFADVI